MGPATVRAYFVEALPATTREYDDLAWNQSLWTIGTRLFHGTDGIVSPPIVEAPLAGAIVSVALPTLVLVAALAAARPPLPLGWAVGVMLCVSTVVNPIAWPHYLILLILPAGLVIRWLVLAAFPMNETLLAALAGLLLAPGTWEEYAFRLAG